MTDMTDAGGVDTMPRMAPSKIFNFRISAEIRAAIDAHTKAKKAVDEEYTFSGELLKKMCDEILGQPDLVNTLPPPGRPPTVKKTEPKPRKTPRRKGD